MKPKHRNHYLLYFQNLIVFIVIIGLSACAKPPVSVPVEKQTDLEPTPEPIMESTQDGALFVLILQVQV